MVQDLNKLTGISMHDKVIKSESLSVSKHLENLTIDWKL